jgi:calcium/calmodulin-dependent protein kinase I
MNKYDLLNKIGSGGYGSVYKCVDNVGARYACKVIPKSKSKRFRVQKEIENFKFASMITTKVPKFVDACEDVESFYIVQEMCRGGLVKDYVEMHGLFSENTVASIVRGVLRSLHHMHYQGIIHGDIKPGNILLADKSDDAEVKITDFGTSQLVSSEDDSVEMDVIIGTPWFMAPELLNNTMMTRSDIWSVGVLTYQMLSGNMPFNDPKNPLNPNVAAIWYSILYDESKQKIDKLKGLISDDALDFLKICLEKDVEKRPNAKECLAHPWLTKTDCVDRFKGTPLYVTPFIYTDNAMTGGVFGTYKDLL